MHGSRKIRQRVQLWQLFFTWWRKRGSLYHFKRAIIGPPAKRQNAIKMAFHWRTDDGPKLNAGSTPLLFFRRSGSILLRYPIFCDFSRGIRAPCAPPSGSAHVFLIFFSSNFIYKTSADDKKHAAFKELEVQQILHLPEQTICMTLHRNQPQGKEFNQEVSIWVVFRENLPKCYILKYFMDTILIWFPTFHVWVKWT